MTQGHVHDCDGIARANEPADAAKAGLSIVVPVYNEAPAWPACTAHRRGGARLRRRWGLACEIIYVDDGSRDNS